MKYLLQVLIIVGAAGAALAQTPLEAKYSCTGVVKGGARLVIQFKAADKVLAWQLKGTIYVKEPNGPRAIPLPFKAYYDPNGNQIVTSRIRGSEADVVGHFDARSRSFMLGLRQDAGEQPVLLSCTTKKGTMNGRWTTDLLPSKFTEDKDGNIQGIEDVKGAYPRGPG